MRLLKFSLALTILLNSLSLNATTNRTGSLCERMIETASEYVPSTLGQAASASLKVIFYPLYFPVKAAFVLTGISTSLKREILPALLYGILFFENSAPTTLLARNLTTAPNELFNPLTHEVAKDGNTIGINADTTFSTASDFMSGAGIEDPRFFHQGTLGVEAWIRTLIDLKAKHGSIKRLVLVNTGRFGSMTVGNEVFDSGWFQRHPEILKELPGDLFAKGAEIILIGPQYKGEDSLVELPKTFQQIAKKGATIVVSTRFVRFDELSIPKEWSDGAPYWQRLAQQELGSGVVSPVGIYEWLRGDKTTRDQKIIRIPVAPVN